MLACLITHPGDRALALQLCQQIASLGGVSTHEALIVAPFGTEMIGIEDTLRSVFGRVETHFYRETLKGWPYGANEAAGEAMLHIAANPALKYHFLMLEPDCIPVAKFWLDNIDTEYRRCGMPVLGVRLDTVEIATRRTVGKHTVGVAVYPNNFAQLCPLVRGVGSMSNDYQRQNAMPMPWDAYFGPYTAKITAETQLNQHLPRVRSVDANGVHWDIPSVEEALRMVRRDAVLIHGAKNPEFFTRLTGKTYAPQTKQSQHPQESSRREEAFVHRENSVHTRQESSDQGSKGNGVVQSSQPVRQEQPLAPSPVAQEALGENLPRPGYAANAKVRARQISEKEAIRIELGIEAPIDTPPFRRAAFFHLEAKWHETRAYASKNLGLKTHGRKKSDLINEIVRIEMEQRKEKWTEVLPPPISNGLAELLANTPEVTEEQKRQMEAIPLEELPVEEAPLPPMEFGRSQASPTVFGWQDAGAAETSAEAVAASTKEAFLNGGISPAQQERMKQLLADRQKAGVL